MFAALATLMPLFFPPFVTCGSSVVGTIVITVVVVATVVVAIARPAIVISAGSLIARAIVTSGMDLPRLSGEAFAQRDAVRSNCAGLM